MWLTDLIIFDFLRLVKRISLQEFASLPPLDLPIIYLLNGLGSLQVVYLIHYIYYIYIVLSLLLIFPSNHFIF